MPCQRQPQVRIFRDRCVRLGNNHNIKADDILLRFPKGLAHQPFNPVSRDRAAGYSLGNCDPQPGVTQTVRCYKHGETIVAGDAVATEDGTKISPPQ